MSDSPPTPDAGANKSRLYKSRYGDTDIGPDHSEEHYKMLERLKEDKKSREECLRALRDE